MIRLPAAIRRPPIRTTRPLLGDTSPAETDDTTPGDDPSSADTDESASGDDPSPDDTDDTAGDADEDLTDEDLNPGEEAGSQTLDERLGIRGHTRLVLMDGVTLTTTEDVRVASGYTLTVYGQANDSGTLIATGRAFNGQWTSGIGSNSKNEGAETEAGTIIIHGGTVRATGTGLGAAIGGGYESGGGSVTIYGGNVTAKDGESSTGIGGGSKAGKESAVINIYGGRVTATGGHESAGIGGSFNSNGTVCIYGGVINATGGSSGAGIGGGSGVSAGYVCIVNGAVIAENDPEKGGPGNGCGSASICVQLCPDVMKVLFSKLDSLNRGNDHAQTRSV